MASRGKRPPLLLHHRRQRPNKQSLFSVIPSARTSEASGTSRGTLDSIAQLESKVSSYHFNLRREGGDLRIAHHSANWHFRSQQLRDNLSADVTGRASDEDSVHKRQCRCLSCFRVRVYVSFGESGTGNVLWPRLGLRATFRLDVLV